jgi:hypothetical protein
MEAKPKIKKLKFPPDKLKRMQQIADSNISDTIKKNEIKRIAGVSSCCVCWGIPGYEITYKQEGATRIERYCTECFAKRKENDSKYVNPNKYFVMLPKKQWPDKLEKLRSLGISTIKR